MKTKSILKKISLGFAISGGVLAAPGIGLFVAGSVGTYNINVDLSPKQETFKSSGYFNEKHNWAAIQSLVPQFNKEEAKKNNVNFDIFGFINYYNKVGDDGKSNPNANPQFYPQFVTKQEFSNFLNAINTDWSLFVSGAVLWPIGATLLLMSLVLFITDLIKNRNRS